MADAKDVLDNTVCQGQDLEMEYNVFNAGFESTGPITVSFYLSTDRCIRTTDHLVGSVGLASLAANTWTNPTATLTVPCDVPPGTYS